jgi:hypothetical protein
LCLSVERCGMNRRAVLTEIGPDTEHCGTGQGTNLIRLASYRQAFFSCPFPIQMRPPCACTSATFSSLVTGRSDLAANRIASLSAGQGASRSFNRFHRPTESPDGPHTHVFPICSAISERTRPPDRSKRLRSCAHLYPAHPSKDPAKPQPPTQRVIGV